MDPQQEMSNETLETILVSSTKGSIKKMEEEMKKKLGKGELGGEAQKCPRCESSNTKFCYYNNYSLSQPRYFCKSCRRYWTKGGTLRNVPVGGGCRRNKRSSSSFSKNINKPINFHNPLYNPLITGMPSSFGYDSIDINLAFAALHKHSPSQATPSFGFGGDVPNYGNSTNTHSGVLGNGLNFGGQNSNFNNGSLCYGFMSGNENESKTTSSLGISLEGNERKQENVNNNNNVSESSSKALWGFPWQMTGNSAGGVLEIDSGRESWNGLVSSWNNGLLNSPLV
ncbi:unnamed protein product [Eruca vesicaria subsp. sativa]|uniref:Dof zinc finger protein n=1 Tax=Eruca vesicaria subsp. sativa TaxID=29727 RepID=A0ABC8KPR3_ERUVS|nr:unnamed protein product [Eruca vesicaria subsp. sativa]